MSTTITSYSTLQTAITSWSHRADLATQIPDFIAIVEMDINRKLRDWEMGQRSYTTMVGGQSRYALPTDYGSLRNIEVISGTRHYPLVYRVPEHIDELNDGVTSGIPSFYTIAGGEIEVSPPPDSAYELHVIYIQGVPALSASATTNWLLDRHPDIYLFGALANLADYARAEKDLVKHTARYNAAVRDLSVYNEKRLYPGPLEVTADMRVMAAP